VRPRFTRYHFEESVSRTKTAMLNSLLAIVGRLLGRKCETVGGAKVEPPSPGAPGDRRADLGHVRGLVGKVSDVTFAVAGDVGKHTHSVQALSSQLSALAHNDASAVEAIICKLLLANQELQGRLERAEETLQDHSRQLDDAVSTSRTDSLTGLFNRRALDEELRRCLAEFHRRGRPAALMMLDVDHFKQFNDQYGHLAGDQALIHVAETLRSGARDTDIVARFGGEEFAVIFSSATAAGVRDRAEQLRAAIGRQPVLFEGREMRVTASAGISDVGPEEKISDWIKRADSGLYAAKAAGRDCCVLIGDGEPQLVKRPLTNRVGDDARAVRSATEAAAELAAEAFADTTFVPSVARRIAEWKRGGATLTVVLARLDAPSGGSPDGRSSERRPSMRSLLQAARECIREMDMVTRWQRDGLALLLPNTSAADAKIVARRLRTALAGSSLRESNHCPEFTAGIGIAEGIEGNDAKRVLERAWLALEAARNTGPANIYIHDGLKTVAVKLSGAARS